jgi:hypothetical protein
MAIYSSNMSGFRFIYLKLDILHGTFVFYLKIDIIHT